MKIEELYENVEPKQIAVCSDSARTVVRISRREATTNKCLDLRKPSQTSSYNVKSKHSPGRKSKSRSKMRQEHLNRHEEHSFLIEAETNKAILDNIISKNDVCQFLTPLKFIEIDTWRKDVPYGLAQHYETERRKWKSPLEILTQLASEHEENAKEEFQSSSVANKKSYSRNTKRQTPQPLSSQNAHSKRKNVAEKNSDPEVAGTKNGEIREMMDFALYNCQGKDDSQPSKTNKPPLEATRRPATSPERHVILSKIKSEKILTRRQNSALTTSKGKECAKLDARNESKVKASYDSFPFSAGFYNRSPRSSTASILKTIASPRTSSTATRMQTMSQESEETLMKSSYKFQPMEFRQVSHPHSGRAYSAARQQLYSEITLAAKMSNGAIRPRTRGGEGGKFKDPLAKIFKDSVSNSKGETKNPHPPEEKQDGSHAILQDPNVAYVPHSRRNQGYGVDKSGKYYAKSSRQHNVVPASSIVNGDALNQTSSNKESGSQNPSYEIMHLPRTSMFSANYASPRASDFSPRVIYTGEMLTNRSWTSKSSYPSQQSPWVTQALPDFSKSEVVSKAERDGYYVRKATKAVSFRLGEGLPKSQSPLNGSSNNQNSSPSNISMVVVNVDEPSVGDSARNIISRGGAIGISSKANGFATGNVIPVRH